MIEINNLTAVSADDKFLRKICQKVLEKENKKDIELSIALVGQGRMRKLNKKYRKKNKVTDVLSFQYNNSGEIAVCLREVKKNAKKTNIIFEEELARVLLHGLLHLLGYDHEKSKIEAEKMREKEESYLLEIRN